MLSLLLSYNAMISGQEIQGLFFFPRYFSKHQPIKRESLLYYNDRMQEGAVITSPSADICRKKKRKGNS